MVATVTTDSTTFAPTLIVAPEAPLTYFADPMHFPRPLSPLFVSVHGPSFERGFTKAVRELRVPLLGARFKVQNHYFFNAIIPAIPANADEAREMGQLAEATLKVEAGRLMERWTTEHLPLIRWRLHRIETVTVADAKPADVVDMLDELQTIWAENWTTHFRIVIPMMLAKQLFDELYVDLFGGTEQDAHALLIGAESESIKAGMGLSDLAGSARAAGLTDLLLSTPAERVPAALARHPMGGYFAAAIRDYLREYGLRQDLFDFTTPTWRENPSIVIALVQAYLRNGHDARAEHAASSVLAEKAQIEARQQLAVYPEAVRGQFAGMLQAARAAYFLQEEHNFYIDQQMVALTRLLFLKLGERLVTEGALVESADIFMLSIDEVRAAVSGDRESARRIVPQRMLELLDAAKETPPPFIGPAPMGPPPADSPIDRAMARFFGGPPQQAEQPNQVKGNSGSRGIARGMARVVQTLDEAKTLQPGEILVTITTMPAWTPLFGTAAAVVTETGGALSHCAIVAREYGIPAVVGVYGATRAIATGQTISVDGTSGLVTIETE
jgi:phosphohistidine swiveling domain-containing protein